MQQNFSRYVYSDSQLAMVVVGFAYQRRGMLDVETRSDNDSSKNNF